MELRETIDLEVERLGLPALRTELAALEQELWSLGRRESELRRSISLWDRWMIFTDTAAEKQVKGGRRRRGQVAKSLAFVRAQVDAANGTLGELCPPFAVAVGLAECLPLAYTGLAVEGLVFRRVGRGDEMRAALGELIALLRRTYFPGLDFAALRARLADAGACQTLAGLAELPLPMHPRLGHAPLEGDAPLGKVAERLLDNGFFAARYREDELARRCAELQGTAQAAEAAVGFWDRINVLSSSSDELVRDEAKAETNAAQEELRKVVDRQQRLLHDAMRAYPPLDFYHGVVEALGIVALLRADKEPVISAKGTVEKPAVVVPRALLLAAIRRLQESFAASFPGVPAPRELANRSAGEAPRLQGHAAATAFMARAAASKRLCALRDEALVHAGMIGQLGSEIEQVEGQISLVDRLVFWSDTDAEQAAKTLARRAEANVAWTWALWEQMLAEARKIGTGIGPLVVRDWAIAVIGRIAAIHTDSGSSSFPKDCQVYKREEAESALSGLRAVFARIYGVTGGVSELMVAAMAARPAEHLIEDDPIHGYTHLTPDELHAVLAQQLAGTTFRAQYLAVQHRLGSLRHASDERTSVEEDISLWDRLNVFGTTEAEARRDELKAQIGDLKSEVGEQRAQLGRSFWEALRAYPPALLRAELDAVAHAVEDIRAVCQSYTVTTGSGNNRRTETRYRCALLGLSDAVSAMTRWSAMMVKVFGEQLGYHELLEALELEPATPAEAPQS